MPASLRSQRATSYKKLRSTANNDLIEALDQCLRYTQHTGAQYACACNGAEWVFFKPNQPYRALPDACVILFSSFDDILKDLDTFESLLSISGVESENAEKELVGREVLVPYFAKRLRDAFPYRREYTAEEEEYSHILDQLLAQYVVDITEDDAFNDCYVPVRTNKKRYHLWVAQSMDKFLHSGLLNLWIQSQVRQLHSPETLWDSRYFLVS